MSTYTEAVAFLDNINKYSARPGIENSSRLLDLLGHPEATLPIIHVAGTNGKGSVCAFLADILTAQGFRTGLFISPHLVDIRERIQLDRQLISREDFAAAFTEVQAAVQELTAFGYPGVTYFDYLFAMAMCYYQKAGADYVIMETGLGGRFDSTNAVANPLLTIITSVSFDHTEILGDTLSKIAYEKAGIIKPGVPLIYCADQPEVADTIQKEYALVHSREKYDHQQPTARYASAIPVRQADCTLLSLEPGKMTYKLTLPDTPAVELTVAANATYQMENSAIAYTAAVLLCAKAAEAKSAAFLSAQPTALQATDSLRTGSACTLQNACAALSPASLSLIQDALSHSHWEGRLEQVAPDVYIDGAHNADGIQMLLASFALLRGDRPATLLFTAVKEKDTNEMIREICESRLFSRYILTTVGGPRALAPSTLSAQFRQYTDAPIAEYDDPMNAFQTALAEKQPSELLLAAGSLYLVGDIKAYPQKH